MQRIDSDDNLFHDGDPANNTFGTIVSASWLNAIQEELASIIEAAGKEIDSENQAQLTDVFTLQAMIVRDEKASGTPGGDAVLGSNIRSLNTVAFNSIVGASLASNQITLPPGKYYISASAPGAGNSHRLSLYNITSGSTLILGTCENSLSQISFSTVDPTWTRAFLEGIFVLDAETTFEIRHYFGEAVGGDWPGLGQSLQNVSDGLPEVYTTVFIKRAFL